MQSSSYLGRTILITLLAAGLFGVFLLVAPKLTASGGGTAAATTTLAAATTTAPITVTTTTAPAAESTTTTTQEPQGWNPEEMTPENGYDGSVTITSAVSGPEGASESAIIADGDAVSWQLHVTNATAGELWGVYAWVEGFGRAYCDSRHLDAGESTDCWAVGTAYAGVSEVVAWVNAWTDERQVKDQVLVELVVAA